MENDLSPPDSEISAMLPTWKFDVQDLPEEAKLEPPADEGDIYTC